MAYYTTAEVAAILKLKQKTVRDMCRDGRIGSFKIGKDYRITDEDIEEFVKKCRQGTQPGTTTSQ